MAKIAFLQNLWFEWLGVMYLSAALKKEGHDTEIFIGTKKKIVKELKRYNPDIILMSVMNIQYSWLKGVVKELRKKNFKQPIIAGGPHATFSPQDIIQIDGIDAVCIGEGEEAIREFVESIAKKKSYDKIENLWIKKSNKADNDGNLTGIIKNPVRILNTDLDKLPWPDRDLYRKYEFFKKGKPYELFLASRGCPYNCSFCFNHKFRELYKGKGRALRFRSPQNVVDEIKYVHKKYGIQNVMFTDSTFNLDKQWLIEFCNLFAGQTTLPMSCNIRANIMDEDIAKALANARCDPARFAIETGNEILRNSILQKNVTDEQIYNTASLLKKYKIPFVSYNMMGLPTETSEMAWQTIHMNQKINPDVVDINLFIPCPNLNITKYAQRHGLIDENSFKKMSEGKYKMFRSVLKQKDIKMVSNLHKFSILLIRFPILGGVVKKLIKLPENIIFDGIYGLSTVAEFIGWSKASKKRAIMEIAKNFRELT